MGKKAKLKAIRRLASKLPPVPEAVKVGSLVEGSELIEKKVLKVEGDDVEAGKKYRNIKTVVKPMNHNRKMKALYNKHGKAGVAAYIKAVVDYDKARVKKVG